MSCVKKSNTIFHVSVLIGDSIWRNWTCLQKKRTHTFFATRFYETLYLIRCSALSKVWWYERASTRESNPIKPLWNIGWCNFSMELFGKSRDVFRTKQRNETIRTISIFEWFCFSSFVIVISKFMMTYTHDICSYSITNKLISEIEHLFQFSAIISIFWSKCDRWTDGWGCRGQCNNVFFSALNEKRSAFDWQR